MKNSSQVPTPLVQCTPETSCLPLNAGVIRSVRSGEIPSNRPDDLPEDVRCDWPLDSNGDPRRKFVVFKPSHKNPLEGLIYDPSTMSLTGLLSSGVNLTEARLDLFPNDPNDAARLAESKVLRYINDFPIAVDVPAEPSPAESSPTEFSPAE